MSLYLSGYQVELSPVRPEDLEMIRRWRNDTSVSQYMLSDRFISEKDQEGWFQQIQLDPRQAHWVISYKNQPIGVANIRAAEGAGSLESATVIEPALYIADLRYRGNILSFAPTLLMNDYCFETLGAQELTARVRVRNEAALRYNQKLGYREVDYRDGVVQIRLTREAYREASAPIKAFLSRPQRNSNTHKGSE